MTESPKESTASKRTLVVDDDPTIVLLLEHVLEGVGRSYETAADGEEGWAAWERSRHELVVLDIEMPKMDGLEVCRRIRAADVDRKTFVLVLTGRDRPTDLEAALDAGADDYVTKPVTGQRLLARMRIAQRRMAEEDELRRARYLAGIGEMTVTLQHEINNPLTGLLGTAEMMLLDAREKGEPTEDIEVVITQGKRIKELVRRMGDMRDPQSVTYAGERRMLDVKRS
ncbi:MAG TPA: response regulator [Gemmatimonadaceae bacterium]|nr:response regulator [Gemmatimonadaceae bacterium]